GILPPDGAIICTGHQSFGTKDFLREVFGEIDDPGGDTLERFFKRIRYVPVDATDQQTFASLAGLLAGRSVVRVFYLATAPRLFAPICDNLAVSGLITPESRVVLEKPIGHDLQSSREINDSVGRVFDEDQIYRIDHYLGKETVQNLMVLRFANPLFERPWSAADIDHVQITCAECIGVGSRGSYYDRAGALRDMVQNHVVQLLCLIAMEPPSALDKDSVRDEKLKVLKALRPIAREQVLASTVRGQYGAGAVDGEPVSGYLADIEVEASNTETFVAIRAEIDNWRWSGVPFFLRTGKRMPEHSSEIIITFKQIRHSIFPEDAGPIGPNRLIIRLQPDEGISQVATMKAPGSGRITLVPASLQLNFKQASQTRIPDAYERLLGDVIRGDPTLFMRRDEVEASWLWVEPILAGWQNYMPRPTRYAAGTWGPSASIALIEREKRSWHEDA
ncbi:MAG: glucose-6-phosphate dehydrogenase, partial [Acetobacteraceae bacterium]|nr:glucose-6-phosphate dehydrogenase [Acetobacteraceae bacterium]